MNMTPLFHPKSVAVVGASRDEKKVGYQIVKNLLKSSELEIFAVNPKGEKILGLQSLPSIQDIQKHLDVVFIAVPFDVVESIIDQCVQKKVGAVVLISAGFAETGEAGKQVQERIVKKLTEANIILLGPNTMGYIVPAQFLFGSFGVSDVQSGSIAVISQSGAMLSALYQAYSSAHTGISFAVSLGNRAGVNENELLAYAEKDSQTRAIALYMESFQNIPQFMEVASRIVRTKPVFLLKGGTTTRGATTAVSHTAALATPQALLHDAAEQAGVVLLETFEQFVRATTAAEKTPSLPKNLMVITNAGGPAVVLIDEASTSNVPLSKITPQTEKALIEAFPKLHIANPLDLLGDANADALETALHILSADTHIDALAVLITQQAVTDMEAITRVLSKPQADKAVFVSLIGGEQLEPYRVSLAEHRVIVSEYPNEVVETMSALQRARTQMSTVVPHILQTETPAKQAPQTFQDLQSLLETTGLLFPKQQFVHSLDALSSIQSLQFPLVAKTTDLTLKHKAKIGAVITNILDERSAEQAFAAIQKFSGEVVFQETIVDGVQALVGLHHDLQFGWFLAVGLGGSLSDTFEDRAYVFLPAAPAVFARALERTKLFHTFSKAQTEYCLKALVQLQTLALSMKDLSELEINPLFVTEYGCVVADMKCASR